MSRIIITANLILLLALCGVLFYPKSPENPPVRVRLELDIYVKKEIVDYDVVICIPSSKLHGDVRKDGKTGVYTQKYIGKL